MGDSVGGVNDRVSVMKELTSAHFSLELASSADASSPVM